MRRRGSARRRRARRGPGGGARGRARASLQGGTLARRAERQHAQQRHLEAGARAGRQAQVAAAGDRHLVPQLHQFGRQLRGQPGHVHRPGVGLHAGHHLQQLDAVHGGGQVFQHVAEIGRERGQFVNAGHQRGAVAGGQRGQQRAHLRTVHGAQHRVHRGGVELASGVGNGLVEQRQPVAQAAVGGAGQQSDGGRLGGNGLGLQDAADLAADLGFVQAPQVELQAARQHGDRQLLRVGGGQQELHVFRRLFQGLEQRVERRLGQHVHFVDQVDLGLAARRQVLGVVDQVAHVVHAGVAGGVDFQQVHVASGVNVAAGRALAAGFGAGAALAVERLGEDAGDGGLAHAAGAGEQEGVVDLAGLQRIAQRTHHVLLPHQFGEAPRAPFSGKDQIGHAGTRDGAGLTGPLCQPPRPRASANRRACSHPLQPVSFPACFRRLSLRRDVRAVEGARLESV